MLLDLVCVVLSALMLVNLNLRDQKDEVLRFMHEFAPVAGIASSAFVLSCPCLGLTLVVMSYANYGNIVGRLAAALGAVMGIATGTILLRMVRQQLGELKRRLSLAHSAQSRLAGKGVFVL